MQFDKQKDACLSAVDLSRKGSVDEPICDLVNFINKQADYFTTSSCSGRIIVVDNNVDGTIQKQGCRWLLTSHDTVTATQLVDSLQQSAGNAVFKFEPFVLHVQCRTLEDAQHVLSCGVQSGFRNSGISVGNKGKFITAIRSTQSLEVPLTKSGKLLVDKEYLEFLVDQANGKTRENLGRIDRFYKNLKAELENHREKKSKQKNASSAGKKEERNECHGNVQRGVSEGNEKSVTVDYAEELSQCVMFDGDLGT